MHLPDSVRSGLAELEADGWSIDPPTPAGARVPVGTASGGADPPGWVCSAVHRSGYRALGAGESARAAAAALLGDAREWLGRNNARYRIRVLDLETAEIVWRGEQVFPAWIEVWMLTREIWERYGRPVTVTAGRLSGRHVVERNQWTCP